MMNSLPKEKFLFFLNHLVKRRNRLYIKLLYMSIFVCEGILNGAISLASIRCCQASRWSSVRLCKSVLSIFDYFMKFKALHSKWKCSEWSMNASSKFSWKECLDFLGRGVVYVYKFISSQSSVPLCTEFLSRAQKFCNFPKVHRICAEFRSTLV